MLLQYETDFAKCDLNSLLLKCVIVYEITLLGTERCIKTFACCFRNALIPTHFVALVKPFWSCYLTLSLLEILIHSLTLRLLACNPGLIFSFCIIPEVIVSVLLPEAAVVVAV